MKTILVSMLHLQNEIPVELQVFQEKPRKVISSVMGATTTRTRQQAPRRACQKRRSSRKSARDSYFP
jgi:hypothetical protein